MTNQELLCSILSLSAIDGSLNQRELEYFDQVCSRIGASPEEKNMALEKARQGKGSIYLPQDDVIKKRLVYFLLQAAVSDGPVTPEEQKVLDAVVARLGISKNYVERFLTSRLAEIQEERERATYVTCPKCGFEQPPTHECRRCRIIFKRYKQARQAPMDDVDRLKELLSSTNVFTGNGR